MDQQSTDRAINEERIKNLIVYYDDCIRLQKKFLDCGFAEALVSIIPLCMENQNALADLLNKKANDCKRLKNCLEVARDKVAKLVQQHEKNTHLKEFLDFSIFLSTFRDSNEDIDVVSNSGGKNLLQYYDISLKNKISEELNKNNTGTEHESKVVELQFDEIADECTTSKLPLNKSNEDIVSNINPMTKLSKRNEQSPDVSDGISNNGIQKPTSLDELSNSTIPVTSHQSHFECDTCGRYFLKKKSIISHVREHRRKIRLFNCKKCGKSLPKKNSREKLVICHTCDVHDNDHADKDKRKFKFPIIALEEVRNGKSQKIDYFSGKSLSETSSWCCDICGRHFLNKFNLGYHLREVHGGEKPHKCIECGKRFVRKHDLQRHTSVHGSQKAFRCSVCNAGFKYLSTKRRHERFFHEGGAHLQCAHCDERFGEKHQLTSHIYTKHFSGFEKSFKCSACDRHFKYRSSKVRHEKTVHGKR